MFFRKFLLIISIGISVAIYAHWIEPVWIKVTRHTIKARVKTPLRIAHLTDLHIDKYDYRERHLLALLRREKPDAILISGDSISDSGNYAEVGKFLKDLSAPLGVWLVRGNWEHWRPDKNKFAAYSSAGVHFLNNTNHQLSDGIWIIGIDDYLAGTPNLSNALSEVPENGFKIGLFHSPGYFSSHSDFFDLVLAGHTHGGQIRIPFLPPLWLPEGSDPYIEGWYSSKKGSRMYVSRGIGNSILELRFFCRPELPIITIVPNE